MSENKEVFLSALISTAAAHMQHYYCNCRGQTGRWPAPSMDARRTTARTCSVPPAPRRRYMHALRGEGGAETIETCAITHSKPAAPGARRRPFRDWLTGRRRRPAVDPFNGLFISYFIPLKGVQKTKKSVIGSRIFI